MILSCCGQVQAGGVLVAVEPRLRGVGGLDQGLGLVSGHISQSLDLALEEPWGWRKADMVPVRRMQGRSPSVRGFLTPSSPAVSWQGCLGLGQTL